MVGDGEAVRLVADALDEVERLAVARQDDRLALALLEDELELLGEADDGHILVPARPADDLERRRELPLAAVDDDEVGQFFLGQSDIAARCDLAHREEVVGLALRALDLEAPVVRLLGQAALEDDHRGNRLRALDVRDVEALHAVGHLLEAEVVAELAHGAHRLLVGLLDARGLVGEVFGRIALGHRDDVALRAALRQEELHLRALLLLGQPALKQCLLRFGDGHRQQDLARHEGGAMVVLREEGGEDVGVALLLTALQEEVLAADHLARADEEDLHADADLRAREADGVLVARARDDVLLLRDLLDGAQLVPEACRRLEVKGFGRLLHADFELALDVRRAPLEEEQHGADHRRIVLLGDLADARREAALDVILEARPVLQVAAGAQREELAQELEALVHGRDVRVGAEVARAVLRHAVRQEDARVLLLHRDLDVGIALVVLEADVVMRAVLLDEVALEDQRLDLGVRHDNLEVRDM